MKNKLKVCRAEIGISQSELAKKVSVTRQTIISIENSKYVPSTLLALKISRILNKNVEDIFTLEKSDLAH